MSQRLGLALALCALAWTADALAQRPRIGIGVGGGTVLGSRLVDQSFTARVGDVDVAFERSVNLEDVAVLSAHGEWHVIPNVALRAHGAWGGGRLEVQTRTDANGTEVETFDSDFGDVRVTALDVGISVWPWAPSTVGFAPFVTLGIGRYSYDFDAETGDGFFDAQGSRSNRAWALGVGADMNIWHSLSLRMEAVDHVTESPLQASDFAGAPIVVDSGAFDEMVHNIRLIIAAHVYFPFRSSSVPGED